MATTLEIILTAQNRVSGELAKVQRGFKNLEVQLNRNSVATAKNAQATAALGASMQGASTAGRGLFTVLTALGGITLFIGAAKTLIDFEQSLAKVEAVIQPTADEMQKLSDIARELGANTVFTASQAADGIEFLGRAGFTANEALGAIEGTLNLAAAGSLELARAADIASNVLSAFNLDTTEAGRVADVLALAAQSANTNVEQLGEGIKFVGPIAAAFGISIEQTAAALGVLGNAGLQASTAGTGLRRILSTLGTPTKKLNDLLLRLNVSFEDVNPATNDLTAIMETLAGTSLTAADALEVFGDRGAPAILAITSQSDALLELNAALEEAEGTAARTATTLTDTLGGSLKTLVSAFQELILQVGEGGLSEALRDIVETATGVIRVFTGTLDPLDENAELYHTLAAAVESLKFVLLALLAVRTLAFFGGMVTQLALLRTSFLTAATGATGFARAMIGLRTVVLGALGPLGWIVGIGLALVAFAEEDAPKAVNSLLDIDAAVKLVQASVEDFNMDQLKNEIEGQEKTVDDLISQIEKLDAAIEGNIASDVSAPSGLGKTSGGSGVSTEVDRIELDQLEKRREQAKLTLQIAQAESDELKKILEVRLADNLKAQEQQRDKLAALELDQQKAELNAAAAKKNLDAAQALAELETAKTLADSIATIRKTALDQQLAEQTITIDQYYDGLEALAVENLDKEVEIAKQKQAALIELQDQQRTILAARAASETGAARGTAETAAVTARFVAETAAQEDRFQQEQIALDQQLIILQSKRDAAYVVNEAARDKAISAQLDKDIKAFDKQYEAEEKAQQDAFDRRFDAILAQRDREAQAAERDVQTGAQSEFGLGSALDEIDEQAIEKLRVLKEDMQTFSDTSSDPILPEKIAAVGDAIENMAARSEVNLSRVQSSLADGLGDALFDIVDGTKSASEAFKEFARTFLREIAKMIIKQIALNAVKAAFGGFSGGGGVGGLFSKGGHVQGFAQGGFITGKGTTTSDSIPARLSHGEYVMQASAVKNYGLNFMEAINRVKLDANVSGGAKLPNFQISRPKKMTFADGGVVDSGAGSEASAPATNLRVVNVVDTDQTSDYLSSADGESMIVNIIRRNGSTIKSVIG